MTTPATPGIPATSATARGRSSAAPDAAGPTLGTFGVILGGAAVLTALFISGYWAMGMGVLGLPLSFIARARARPTGRTALGTAGVALNIIGLTLGLTAQLMKMWLIARGQ